MIYSQRHETDTANKFMFKVVYDNGTKVWMNLLHVVSVREFPIGPDFEVTITLSNWSRITIPADQHERIIDALEAVSV